MPGRALVLDANILVRAVLGRRVRPLLEDYAGSVTFFVADAAYCEAEEYVGELVATRGGDAEAALRLLRALCRLVTLLEPETYRDCEADARARPDARDPDDWPTLASALALGCPIWTEDTDFFGCDVATWTSDRVRIFLGE